MAFNLREDIKTKPTGSMSDILKYLDAAREFCNVAISNSDLIVMTNATELVYVATKTIQLKLDATLSMEFLLDFIQYSEVANECFNTLSSGVSFAPTPIIIEADVHDPLYGLPYAAVKKAKHDQAVAVQPVMAYLLGAYPGVKKTAENLMGAVEFER